MLIGNKGPEATEAWHTDMERLLKRIGVPTEEMVSLGTFYLRDVAYTWWETVSEECTLDYARQGRSDPDMTWTEFSALFHKRWLRYAIHDS